MATSSAGERLDPRVVPYWLVSGLVGFAVLAALVVGALWALQDKLPLAPRTAWTLAFVVLALQGLWTLVSPPLAHRIWRFSIDDRLLVARFGIVIRQEKVIPTNRLQHVDLVRGPIERLFGLATLVVHTAGTEAVAFRLPGLAAERASALRDRILRARGVDVV
ncbi:MAG: PH domain-containing protein [Planctomycetes bacterium]|nr:PH domain-containing protein [Planctomycetota bacterium]